MSATLLGIDCATKPAKTGLALGYVSDGAVRIDRCALGSPRHPAPALVVASVASALRRWLGGRACRGTTFVGLTRLHNLCPAQ
jgi:hypothetical protein